MLTVTVAAVGTGVGADGVGAVGAAAEGDDVLPAPPLLKSRSAPTTATPAPDTTDVFMRVRGSNSDTNAHALIATSCAMLDYTDGKPLSEIVRTRRRAR
jgi:hypothetical protein